MKGWLQRVLAEQYGIAANLRFLTPGEFVREALNANQMESAASIFSAEILRWRLFSVLSDRSRWQHPAMQTIAPYLRGTQSEMKAWSLAGECAAAFEKYQAWRRDWCLEWDRGDAPLDWQAHLWREVTQGKKHRGQAIADYLAAFESRESGLPQGLPKRLFVFACLNVSPDVLRVIATAAKRSRPSAMPCGSTRARSATSGSRRSRPHVHARRCLRWRPVRGPARDRSWGAADRE